ncbi:hydrogenase maturation protease [Anaeromyxobacter oryzisoli]|uniref:hydrogenase maturation protease n=1 Tax=Anaeromyxobacter oryzisoli TaxID=2925408 RepID=UPI001F5A9C85|nr:hydrogenase maturation protease [Anaeromyxobacter sp. SG63]
MPRRRAPDREARRIPLLVLGLGNVLCGDDGLGVQAVARLAHARGLPRGVRLEDGGVLGLALLPTLEAARRAIIVDAVRCARPAGALVALEGEDVVPALRERLSPHEVGVWDLLWAARLRGRAPERLAILGLVPASLELGVGLSPVVEAALPALVDAVVTTARAWGSAR